MLQKWDLCWIFLGSIKEFIYQWRSPTRNYLLKTLWSFVFPHVAWGLWKEHNNRIFREIYLQPEIVLKKATRAINENISIVSAKSQN